MNSDIIITELTPENLQEHTFCGYKNKKSASYKSKAAWLTKRYKEGLKYIVAHSESEGDLGMIEYAPSEKAWRPINAPGYLFIHCIMATTKGRNRGVGSSLIDYCKNDAKKNDYKGIAVISSDASWMSQSDIFKKNSFKIVNSREPSYDLLAYKISEKHPDPEFPKPTKSSKYSKGLHIVFTEQCPYIMKALPEIESTCNSLNIPITIHPIKTASQAQKMPSVYGVFNIIYNGRLMADHPISNSRFKNIIKTL